MENKNTLIRGILRACLPLLGVIAVYLAFSFVNVSLNPADWHEESRAFCMLICCTFIVISLFIISEVLNYF